MGQPKGSGFITKEDMEDFMSWPIGMRWAYVLYFIFAIGALIFWIING